MVAEGVWACQGGCATGGATWGRFTNQREEMHEVLYEDKDPREAIRELMERPLKSE